jgi:hypothetical protein
MYAGPHRCRLAFFLDVVAAISDEGPGMAVAHHVGPKVAAIGAANRDGASVAIEGPGFAGNVCRTRSKVGGVSKVVGMVQPRSPSTARRAYDCHEHQAPVFGNL